MSHAYMLIVGRGSDSPSKAESTARWHQDHGLWLCNSDFEVLVGSPVVARMAGPSNELLIDGIVAGHWKSSRYPDWDWEHEIAVTWSRHIVRGVRARAVLGEKGTARSAHVALDRGEWAAVQRARL